MRAAPPGWGRASILALALAAVLVGLYLPAVRFDYVSFDDHIYLGEQNLGSGAPVAARAVGAFRVRQRLWIPLTWLSFMAEGAIFGDGAGARHAVNIALHALAMAALLLALWRMTGAPLASALAASLVALHPLRVESVAWVAERKDVLSLALLFPALGCWAGWLRTRRKAWFAAAAALHALSLMAKPMPVSFPFLLLALDFWPFRRLRGGPGAARRAGLLVAEKLPFIAASACVSVLTLAAQRGSLRPVAFPIRAELLVTAPLIHLARTLGLEAAGVRFPPAQLVFHPGLFTLAALGVGAATAAAVLLGRRAPPVTAGWLWYLVSLLPVSGVAVTGMQWIADRFTYLPHAGLAVAIVWGGAGATAARPRARRAAACAAAALLVVLAAATRAQLPVWRNGVTLMREAVALDPGSAAARVQLGLALLERGEPAAAVTELEEGLARDPDSADARFDLAIALAALGRGAEATAQYRELLGRFPDDFMARLNLAEMLFRAGRTEEAAAEFSRVARDLPGTAEGAFAQGRAAAAAGRTEEARASYRAARSLPSALPDVPSSLRQVLDAE